MLQIFLVSLILFSVGPAFAVNHLVYFGGGKQQDPESSVFEKNLQQVLQYTRSQSWQGEFFSSIQETELLSIEEKRVLRPFTQESFQRKIAGLQEDIKSGRIKPGEQLLIYFDTHGNLNEDRNLLLAAGPEKVDVSALKELLQLAESKKVSLGIVGLSCYSGILLRYKTPNTCIIATAQPEKVAFEDDSNIFTKNLLEAGGKTNLEDLYLLSRRQKRPLYGPAQPLISTDAGTMVDQSLAALKNGIYYHVDLMTEQAKPLCKNTQFQVDSLEEQLNRISDLAQTQYVKSRPERLVGLKAKLKKYAALYDQVKVYSTKGSKNACTTSDGKEMCLPANQVDTAKDVITDPSQKKLLQGILKSRAYLDYKNAIKGHEDIYDRMDILSGEISQEERAIYDELYKEASKKIRGPNPCKDFKL